MADLSEKIAIADEIFDQDRLEEAIELYQSFDQSNVQVLWRLARAKYQLSKVVPNKSQKIKLTNEGFDYAKKSLAADDKCAEAHCFYACLLDAVSELYGLRERATRLKDVKAHLMRAVELNPNDAISRHGLGVFMYEIADMAWYKRKIVEAVFAKPPDGSYSEALEHFLIAEQIEPNFYSLNKLMTAKAYLALKDYGNARKHLIIAASVVSKCEDDEKCINEAKALLAKYK